MTSRESQDRLPISALTLVVKDAATQPLRYALGQLAEFCEVSAGIRVQRDVVWPPGTDTAVLVGRSPAQRLFPEACRGVAWEDLGNEGYILRSGTFEGRSVIVAAGATDAGTRHAVYALMRALDVTTSPPTLPADPITASPPAFRLRGMYAHQHWAYNHPYSLRTWSVDEWKQYVDLLALMGVNLLQIWSMAGICPVPLSPDDGAFLRRYPPVIDHAHENHGMEVWIGECANNVCDRDDVPPIAERLYFDVECLKDPGDPEQLAQLRVARAEFYRICNNADGYWIIDSDPGKWEGSAASEFVDIVMMNRELINEHTRLGADARLVYWMWDGWGTGSREQNWRDIARGLVERSPEPWCMTVAWDGHWEVADELGLGGRVVYYPYGAIEPEPSLPFTTVVPRVIPDVLNLEPRAARVLGAMGNAQTPLCQLPNMYYFTRALWDMSLRDADREAAVRELARLIYPTHADLVARCWMSLASPDAPAAAELAAELTGLCETSSLGKPGPIGMKLFPGFDQVARDLVTQLRIHGAAMDFCRMADDESVAEATLLEQLKQYCLLSLAWRRQNGFRRFGTNGYDFFPLLEAAHRHWWRGDHLDKTVYTTLEKAMRARYEPWEAELILYPLDH